MTSFDTRKPDSDGRMGRAAAPEWTSVQPEQDRPVGERSERQTRRRVLGAAERDRLLVKARESEFPIAMRGYDRVAVDRYVESVNRIIAELEMTASPESAVKHALEEVSDETRDILQRAHETADEITARSRAKADDRLQQAEREAQETQAAAEKAAEEAREDMLQTAQQVREAAQREVTELRGTALREITDLRNSAVSESEKAKAAARREADKLLGNARQEAGQILGHAETRARELAHNTDMIWRERRRLVEDIRAVGEQLASMGELEAKRFAHLAETLTLGDQDGHEETAVISPGAPEITKPE
jgi:cell division septum initiation protein DivIVA